jgi:tRNA(fMet)-specific endonuclease VapC
VQIPKDVDFPEGPNDMLIAGHARSPGLTVVTGKLKEFARVEGLRCVDWLAG